MKTICSHTLVKNGMPFIGLVLNQVAPYVNRMLITASVKTDEDTLREIYKVQEKYKDKVVLKLEDVSNKGLLTQERQKQVNMTYEDWIWFLDDDDYWPNKSIRKILDMIEVCDCDGLAFNPFQVIDEKSHDNSWRYKWFTKLFPNLPGLHYVKPWPEDCIFINDRWLYWRANKDVIRAHDCKFMHLSNIKLGSFRNELKEWKEGIGEPKKIPSKYKVDMERIYDTKRNPGENK